MTAAQRLAAVLETLADKHHRMLTNSKLHDPERRGFRDCECKTCRDASAALDAVPARPGGEPSEEAVEAARKALAGVAPYPYPGSLEAALKAAYAADAVSGKPGEVEAVAREIRQRDVPDSIAGPQVLISKETLRGWADRLDAVSGKEG